MNNTRNIKGYLMATLLLASNLALAQHHPHSLQEKNIFLAMMDKMMVQMDDASTNEFTEAGFILQMIPHHEAAIKMAVYEIAHGKDFTMIQLAKSILAEQTNEVRQMRLWEKQPWVTTSIASADFQQSINQSMLVMMQDMPINEALTDTDRAFAKVMIPHHQAAIDMAKAVINSSTEGQIRAFAKSIISSQQVEIEQMASFLK